MLIPYIILMSHISLGVGNMTCHSVQLLELRWGAHCHLFQPCTVLPFFKLWTTCSERHNTSCDLSGWLILLPWRLSNVLVALRIATALSVWVGVGSSLSVAVYLSETQLLAHTFDSSFHTYTRLQSADVQTHIYLLSIAWWNSVWAMCHTLAAKALTWPLLSTDGFTSALQGLHKHTQRHKDCTLDHWSLLCFFKNISLQGVKEKERTEECHPADMATP